MPFSSESGKAAIKQLMQRIKPQTGLDDRIAKTTKFASWL